MVYSVEKGPSQPTEGIQNTTEIKCLVDVSSSVDALIGTLISELKYFALKLFPFGKGFKQ